MPAGGGCGAAGDAPTPGTSAAAAAAATEVPAAASAAAGRISALPLRASRPLAASGGGVWSLARSSNARRDTQRTRRRPRRLDGAELPPSCRGARPGQRTKHRGHEAEGEQSDPGGTVRPDEQELRGWSVLNETVRRFTLAKWKQQRLTAQPSSKTGNDEITPRLWCRSREARLACTAQTVRRLLTNEAAKCEDELQSPLFLSKLRNAAAGELRMRRGSPVTRALSS